MTFDTYSLDRTRRKRHRRFAAECSTTRAEYRDGKRYIISRTASWPFLHTRTPKPASDAPPVRVRKVIRAGRRDTVSVNGQVLCCVCRGPVPTRDAIPARFETDGLQRITVVTGHTFHAPTRTLVPVYGQRHIPRQVSGVACVDCMTAYNGRPTGRMAQPADEHVEQFDTHVKANGFAKSTTVVVDDSTGREAGTFTREATSWAHTSDPGWLSGARSAAPDANLTREAEELADMLAVEVLAERMEVLAREQRRNLLRLTPACRDGNHSRCKGCGCGCHKGV